MTTIYVTKDCLNSGLVRKMEVEETSQEGMYKLNNTTYFHKSDYRFSEKEAIEHANILRERKLTSLKKNIAKLEAMDFGGAK